MCLLSVSVWRSVCLNVYIYLTICQLMLALLFSAYLSDCLIFVSVSLTYVDTSLSVLTSFVV